MENCIPSGREVSISARGDTDCLALNCVAPSTALDLSTHLANSTSLSLPWLYRKNVHFTTMKVESLHNVFPLGMQTSRLAHDWGLDLHNNIPCELPREVGRDALVMSSWSSGSSSEMMVKSVDLHNRLDWPSLQMGNSSDARKETPLAVDFSYQLLTRSLWKASGRVARLILRRFSGWLPN